MKTIKQTGFSVVEVLIVIVVIAALAATGWMVYQNRTKLTNSTSNSNQTNPKSQPDVYTGWKTYCDSTIQACIKYPADWVASQYGGLANPACTEYASLTGPTNKDRGNHTAYIASIDDLNTPNSDLKVVGIVVNNQPSYGVYDASYISENNIHVGATQDITDVNYRFTSKTDDAGLVGTPCANGYAAITKPEEAKAWFNTTDGKTVLKVVESFYYQ